MRADNGVQEGEKQNRILKKNKNKNTKRELRNYLGQDRVKRVVQRPGLKQAKSFVTVRE